MDWLEELKKSGTIPSNIPIRKSTFDDKDKVNSIIEALCLVIANEMIPKDLKDGGVNAMNSFHSEISRMKESFDNKLKIFDQELEQFKSKHHLCPLKIENTNQLNNHQSIIIITTTDTINKQEISEYECKEKKNDLLSNSSNNITINHILDNKKKILYMDSKFNEIQVCIDFIDKGNNKNFLLISFIYLFTYSFIHFSSLEI